MSGSTTKKVLIDRFDRQTLRGFVNPETGFQADGVELLTPEGNVSVVPYGQIKVVSYVRDLGGGGVLEDRRQFLARPKSAGLWVLFGFRDGETLEGVLPNDLLGLGERGFGFTPPDVARNTQRVYVPKEALANISVLGVVGSPLRGRGGARRAAESRQIGLFSAVERD